MLIELHIKNLAIIDELRLRPGKGLTVLSGDEGVGKSLLVDALCLLVGGRASASLIRNGTSGALIEGVLYVSSDNELISVLEDNGIEIEPDWSLILTREIQEQGRSIARVNGRAVPVSLLRQIGEQLIDIHSQLEHLSLLSPQHQIDLLDSYGGLLELRSQFGGKATQLRDKTRQLNLVSGYNVDHERELLEYQVTEIEGANIHLGEDEALEQERKVLHRAEELKEGCYTAYSRLYGDDRSAAVLVHQAKKALQGLAYIDPAFKSQIEVLESAAAEL